MKLYWATNYFETGRGYGLSIHNKKLHEAVANAGVELVDSPERADLAVHIDDSECFSPIPGIRNLLFLMTEFTDPLIWTDKPNGATAIVTSSRLSIEAIGHHYKGPIFQCPEGVDPALFRFHERRKPNPSEPFWFLFVGNDLDNRKGVDFLLEAWIRWQQQGAPSNVRLYIKASGEPGGSVANQWPHPSRRDTFQFPVLGVVTDTRDIPVSELVYTYNSAHAFILPSLGEGFGLTWAEGAATGLPVIYTAFSAMVDYLDDSVAYPISDFTMRPLWNPRKPRVGPPTCYGAQAKPSAIVARMMEIYDHYDEALERGRRASERMHSQFTWAQAAQKFIAICERALELPITPAAAPDTSRNPVVEVNT